MKAHEILTQSCLVLQCGFHALFQLGNLPHLCFLIGLCQSSLQILSFTVQPDYFPIELPGLAGTLYRA
ncbi:hypothetical protein FGO68_gene3045 [Halteria grandinella]|uniref:Uncharacterized protein n=1 Tax=Halteria grandinella TaxID=5974 RepID=A0A8J8P4D4_HALGN|nr:hypothetical protein FGO68_gene3045 [Halteria grandinella]